MKNSINKAEAKRGSASEKAGKALVLHDRATKSTHLDATHVSVLPLKTKAELVQDLEKKKASAKKEWQALAKASRVAVKELNEGVDTYCNYVNEVAKGNEEIINDGGLALRPEPVAVKSLDMVTGIVVENGNETGHLKISFEKVKNAHHYEILASTTPEVNDSYRIAKSVSYTKDIDVNSFKRGETAAIKVRAVAGKGVDSPLQSEPIMKYVS